MNIAIIAQAIYISPKLQTNLSGHIQLPVITAKELVEAGHKLTLLTSKPPYKEVELPSLLPTSVDVQELPYASRIPMRGRKTLEKKRKLYNEIKNVYVLRKKLLRGNYDIVHMFGSMRQGLILGFLKYSRLRARCIFTPLKYENIGNGLLRLVYKKLLTKIDHTVASCEYDASNWEREKLGLVTVARPGITKDNLMESIESNKRRKTILYWRCATEEQGVDIFIEAVSILAPKYTDYDFVFAVRNEGPIEEIKEWANKYQNVIVHVFPYLNGVSLEGLFRESICAVMPFRTLSIHPQLALIETMSAGLLLITSDLEENRELIENKKTGLLVGKNNAEEVQHAIEYVIENPKKAVEIGLRGQKEARIKWNWDTHRRILCDVYQKCLAKDSQ